MWTWQHGWSDLDPQSRAAFLVKFPVLFCSTNDTVAAVKLQHVARRRTRRATCSDRNMKGGKQGQEKPK